MKSIGIVGFGEFSKLLITHLSLYYDIVVYSREPIENTGGLKFTPVGAEEALSQHIIIPAIPAQFLEVFFAANKQFVNPQTLIVDVCSVKVQPVEVLQRVLPDTCEILATHPMFGPASAADGLQGQKVMLHPVRINPDKYNRIKLFLKDTLGLKIIETTPEEHDRMMAYVQGLSHYVGRVMQLMDIPETELATAAYNDLLDMKRIQGTDSWELFDSIMHQNPYAMDVNRQFKATLQRLDETLANGDTL